MSPSSSSSLDPMNASKFMDKQIMELSGSSAPADKFFDLLNPQEDHQIDGAASGGGSGVKKEQQQQQKQGEKAEIFPSYEFHPIRAVGSSSPPTTSGGLGGSWPTWGSVDSKLASFNLQVYFIRMLFTIFCWMRWNRL